MSSSRLTPELEAAEAASRAETMACRLASEQREAAELALALALATRYPWQVVRDVLGHAVHDRYSARMPELTAYEDAKLAYSNAEKKLATALGQERNLRNAAAKATA